MARKKRPYTPKIKGCYQCSQRRIDCDGNRPSCAKCTSRGLTCSGFGIKYRFLDGFASRKRPSTCHTLAKNLHPHVQVQAQAARAQVGAWAHGPLDYTLGPEARDQDMYFGSPSYDLSTWPGYSSPWQLQLEEQVLGNKLLQDELTAYNIAVELDETNPFLTDGTSDEEDMAQNEMHEPSKLYETSMHQLPEAQVIDDESGATTPYLDHYHSCASPMPSTMTILKPWQELLLKYFSDNIAPEMVVIDDAYNGWRQLVLPVAWSNEMVMDAVLAASAFHMTGRIGVHRPFANAEYLYARAISQLLHRQNLKQWDRGTRDLIVLSIVVLLVVVMVNGMSDFPIVFQMLESAIDAIGGEEELEKGQDGELGNFLLRQIRKMRVYAAPLVSQDAGVHAIRHHAQESFDCLYFYRRLYPEQSFTFDLIANLRQQAFGIYLNRAAAGGGGIVVDGGDVAQSMSPSPAAYSSPSPDPDPDRASSITLPPCRELTDHFQASLELFPAGSFGEHVLVWPCFIAALDCDTEEQRRYFEAFLERQYQRNGFANILRALELLRTVWRSNDVDETFVHWPALLPGPKAFIM